MSYHVCMIRVAAVAFLLVTVSAAAEDSPLVALAKRTNRQASKRPVITNETLAKSSNKVSFASGDSLPAPALPKAPSTPTSQQTANSPVAQNAPKDLAGQAGNYPTSTARTIDPQSSARTIDPQSTAGTIQPTSDTVRQINPTSTAANIQPQSTAQNIVPQTANPPQ